MRALLRMICRFGNNHRGNIAITFALATIPLIAFIGYAVDLANANRLRSKLQAAADAASVAAISPTSAGYIAATKMTTNGAIQQGADDAQNVFNANLNGVGGFTINTGATTQTVTKNGSTITSVVTFSANVDTYFLGAINQLMNRAANNKITVTGTSKSSASLPLYLDFYLVLDVSGSMGLPSTSDEAKRMQAINPDNYRQYSTGCTLACHFAPQNSACTDSGTQAYPTNNYCLGYAISRVSPKGYAALLSSTKTSSTYPAGKKLPSSVVSGLPDSLTDPVSSGGGGLTAVSNCPTPGTDDCIQLRLDAVGYAVNQLFITANATARIPNQFRIGLYPFITDLYKDYSPLTSSINGDPNNSSSINYAAANIAALLDTNMNASLGSGGTHIDTALNRVNGLIGSVGDGSTSSKTMPYVFLITDGAQDPQTKGVPNGGWAGSNHAVVIDHKSVCKPLKDRGIIVSVLYIPYQKIDPVNASFANDEDDFANDNIANIPDSLQNCASPGFFYTANSPADITAALNAMFNHALVEAHITN